MTPRLVGHRARAWYDWFRCDCHAVAVKVALLVGILVLIALVEGGR